VSTDDHRAGPYVPDRYDEMWVRRQEAEIHAARSKRLPGPDCFAHLDPEKHAECFGRTSCPRERACSE